MAAAFAFGRSGCPQFANTNRCVALTRRAFRRKSVNMKNFIIMTSLFLSSRAFAYPYWSEFTPDQVITGPAISFREKMVIITKGQISSCARFFEHNRFKVKVLDCKNDQLNLKMTYKNNASCDQGMTITRTFRVELPKDCFATDRIIINGKAFDQ